MQTPHLRRSTPSSPLQGLSRVARWMLGGLLAVILGISSAQAQTRWTGNTSGNYGTTTNWIGGVAPNSTGANMQLGPNTVTNRTLTLNGTITLGTITFISSQAYTLTSNILSLNVASGNATILMGNTGSLAINSGLTLNDPFNIQTTAGNTSTLTIAGAITSNNNSIYYNGTGTGTVNISSAYVGTGAITQASSGTLTLGGLNIFSGGTNLSSGTLNLNNGGNATASSLGNGTFTITGGTLNNTSGANVTIGTTNAQAWNGDFTFAGTGNLSLGTGAVTLSANRTVTVSANTLTVAGIITDGAGTFGITKNGAGTLVLSGVNTYNGTTTLNAGTLDIQNLRALGIGGTFVINGGNLDNSSGSAVTLFSGHAMTWNGNFGFTGTQALSLNTSGVTLGADIAINTGGSTLTVAGIITDGASTFGITKNGPGTLILSGTNTFNGTTTLNAGTLAVQNVRALGIGGAVIINGGNIDNSGGSALTLHSNHAYTLNGDFGFTGTQALSLNTSGVTLGANVAIDTAASTLTFAGVIDDGASTFGITKNGAAGTLVLVGANTFNGNVTLNAGTLMIQNNQALGVGGALVINGGNLASSGTINLGTTISQIWNSDWTFNGGSNVNMGTGAVTLTNNITLTNLANTLTIAGIIGDGGSAFGITKAGTATLSLAGANTYSGNTNVEAGTLDVANQLALQNSVVNYTGGCITLTGSAWTFGGLMGNQTLTMGNSDNLTLSPTTGVTANFTGVVAGTASSTLTKAGAGTQVMSNLNTYSGCTTISLGTLSVATLANGGSASGIGQSTGAAANLIFNGGTLQYVGTTDQTTNRLFTVQSSSATIEASGTGTIGWGNTGAIVFNGTAAPRTIVLDGNNTGNNTFSLQITNNGSNATNLLKTGTGVWVVDNAANSYTGNTTINGGTLRVSTLANGGSNSNIGASNSTAANLIINNATLAFNGSTDQSTNRLFTLQTGGGTLESNGSGNIAWGNTGAIAFNGTNAARTLTFGGTNTGNNTFSLAITNNGSGATSVTKNGVGTWILNGTSTYTGPTTVNAGILTIASSGGMGTATNGGTVADGATLKLDGGITTGSIAGANFTITGSGVGGIGALSTGSGYNTWNSNLQLGGNATIGSGTTSGATLQVGQFESQIAIGSNNLTFTGGANTLSWVYSNITGTGAVIVDTQGSVRYYMDGNTYTGGTFINTGTLIIDTLSIVVPQASGNTILGLQGPVKIGDATGAAQSAVLQFGPTNASATNSDNTIAKNAVVTIERDGWLNLNGQIETIGNLTMNGSKISTDGFDGVQTIYGRLSLGGIGVSSNVTIQSNTISATISGNLTLGDSTGTPTTSFNVISGGNVSGDLIVDARVDGSHLYKYGNGTMVMTNSNIYTGNTTIAAGTLNIQNGNALGGTGGTSNGTYVLNNAQLQLQNVGATAAEPLQLNGNGTSNNGALQNVSGNNTWTGTVSVGAGNAQINTSGGNLTISGNIGVVSGTPTLTVYGGGDTSYSGNINGGLSLVKNGAGTLTINGTLSNTFNGSTTVNDGTLALNKTGGGAPAAISGNNIIINTGGTLINLNDDQILATTNMNLAGGTWNTNGKDEGLGTLTLSANSFLELGNDGVDPLGTSQIHYDVSSYATNWTAGQNLYILDWNGNMTTGGVNSQVYFGTNYAGLGGSGVGQEFSQIIFVNPVGLSSGNYIATILSTGEVVPFIPAPEPGTVAVGAGLGILAFIYEMRRRKMRKLAPLNAGKSL